MLTPESISLYLPLEQYRRAYNDTKLSWGALSRLYSVNRSRVSADLYNGFMARKAEWNAAQEGLSLRVIEPMWSSAFGTSGRTEQIQILRAAHRLNAHRIMANVAEGRADEEILGCRGLGALAEEGSCAIRWSYTEPTAERRQAEEDFFAPSTVSGLSTGAIVGIVLLGAAGLWLVMR